MMSPYLVLVVDQQSVDGMENGIIQAICRRIPLLMLTHYLRLHKVCMRFLNFPRYNNSSVFFI